MSAQRNVLAILVPATKSAPAVVANIVRRPAACALCGTAQSGSNYAICPDCHRVNGSSLFAPQPLPGETARVYAARRRQQRALLAAVSFEKFPRAWNIEATIHNDRESFTVRERLAKFRHQRTETKAPATYKPTKRDRQAYASLMERFDCSEDHRALFAESLRADEDPFHPLYDPSDRWELDRDIRRQGRSAVLLSRSFYGEGVLEKHDVDAADDEGVEALVEAISKDLPRLDAAAHEKQITDWLQALRRAGRRVPKDAGQLTQWANGEFTKDSADEPVRRIGKFVNGSFCTFHQPRREQTSTARSSRRYGRTVEPGTLRLSDAALV